MAILPGLIVLSTRISCMFYILSYVQASDFAFSKSLDLGYLQENPDDDMDDIDYEALKNAPRIDPDAPTVNTPPNPQGVGQAQVEEAHAPGIGNAVEGGQQ